MKKFVLMTDSHLGLYGDSDQWLEVSLKMFKWVKQVCRDEKINNIIHCGDFFHNTKVVNKKTLDTAQFIVEDLFSNINIYTIVGNHDIFYKNKITPNSLQVLKNYSNFIIINNPINVDNILLVPWNMFNDTLTGKYCFGHFDIAGFYMNDSFVSKNGMKPSIFNKFEAVYSGHFHKRSNAHNITYLGSPHQMTFSDLEDERGIYIWSNGELEFIENKESPVFLSFDSDNFEQNRNKIKGNIVKLIHSNKFDSIKNMKITNEVKNLNPFKLSVDLSNIIRDEEIEVVEDVSLLNTLEIFKKYTENYKVPENLNKRVLLQMIKNMVDEVI